MSVREKAEDTEFVELADPITKRAVTNDADRLKKYLAKFQFTFDAMR